MMRIALLLAALGVLALAGPAVSQSPPTAAMAQAPPAAPAPVVLPRAIVQVMSPNGIDAAAWSADSRFVYTASGFDREILTWDATLGVIIDRQRLPPENVPYATMLQIRSMTRAADGRSVRLDGEVLDVKQAGQRSGRAYVIDTASRRITSVAPGPLPPLPAGTSAEAQRTRWFNALSVFYANTMGMPRAEAEAELPALPASPDGRWKMVRNPPGFGLVAADGRLRAIGFKQTRESFLDAALSRDGRTLALVQGGAEMNTATGQPESWITLFDIQAGRYGPQAKLNDLYNGLIWADSAHFLAFTREIYLSSTAGMPAPVLRVEAATGQVRASVEARCFITPLPGGGLVGAGLANCRSGVGDDRALARLVDGQWQALPQFRLPAGSQVRGIAADAGGRRLLVATLLKNGQHWLVIADPITGAVSHQWTMTNPTVIIGVQFSPDGRRAWVMKAGGVGEWLPDAPPNPDGSPVAHDLPLPLQMPANLSSDGRQLVVGGPAEDRMLRLDLASGKPLPFLYTSNVIGSGFISGKPIFWAVSAMDGLRLWNTRSGQNFAQINFLANNRFVAAGGDGRYDTNLGPESAAFRWLIPTAPYVSFPPQTFMRDFFEPQMIRKVMDCNIANNCAQVLNKVPSIANLNLLLPGVQIKGVTSTRPGEAEVEIVIRDTVANNGKRSGAYGAKILMNNREVGRIPDPGYYADRRGSLDDWRRVNAIDLGPTGDSATFKFPVQLPSDGKQFEFAVYAFNSDRVKSNTARLRWTPPPPTVPTPPPRPRRAYILTIGVDDYAEQRLDLRFAVNDAGVIADRLAAIPGYEMRRTSLTTSTRGRRRLVSGDHINKALAILAGRDLKYDMRADGHDLSALDKATPDDIVIISFSGHGYTDAAGNFALVPSDALWPIGAAAPDPTKVVSAYDLAFWLRIINAGEIALIIDACHSGAAVNTPDFKPGPMGDTGLGQLAFDKGIRILAATQADDVAREVGSLRQGLLSAALGEGLTDTGGPADRNRDGKVMLDEWLRYAVARLPSLNEEVQRGSVMAARGGVRVDLRVPNVAPPRGQEPSLFDFNPKPSPVILRKQP